MKKSTILILLLLVISLITACTNKEEFNLSKLNQTEKINWFKTTSNDEKKEVLTPQQYHVIIEKKMEATILEKLNLNDKTGNYYTAICDYHLFSSKDKYGGKSGWLDFENINLSNAQFKENYRTEQIEVYSICGEYLGYVEDDNTLKSGKHFVINSASLQFKKT